MRRCNVCGFERERTFFTTRQLPNGKRWTLCTQCAETQDLYRTLEREHAERREQMQNGERVIR